jgi:genome maintenance exonuclease 1
MFSYLDFPTTQVMGKRIYQISDEKYYPSITTVLGGTPTTEKKTALDNWRARVGNQKADQISTAAANRGTNMHLMLERAVRGDDPKIEEFPEEHVNMFKSLRLELKKINKWYGQEVVLYSDTLSVAGRCDLVAEYQGELAIIDYKSSTRAKAENEIGDYWLQAAFYATAHNEMFGTEIEKLVIMMGVENKLPMIFKKTIDDELLLKLAERVCEFYERL